MLDDATVKIISALGINIQPALTSIEALKREIDALNSKVAGTKLTIGGTNTSQATAPVTAQQAMITQIQAEGLARRTAMESESAAKINAINEKSALQRQALEQKTDAAILAQREKTNAQIALMEQQRITAATRATAYDSNTGGFLDLIARHATWVAAGTAVFGTYELIKSSISDISASMTKLKQVLEIVPPYDKSPEKLAKDLKELQEVAGVMATAYGVDFSQVLDVMSQAGRRFKDVASIISATDTALQLVVVDAVPVGDAIAGVEAIMSQFGLSTGEAKQAMYQISAAAHELQVTAPTLIQAIERSGSAFKTMKMNTAESVAAIATLSQMTAQKGGMIGNTWKSLEASFASDKGQKAMKELGVALFDDNGKIEDSATLLIGLQNKWKDLSDEAKMHYATVLAGGKFQYQRLQAFLDDYTGAYQKALAGIKNADAEMQKKLVEAAMTSLPQQLKMTYASFQVLTSEITTEATPALIMFLTSVRNGVKDLQDHRGELENILATGVKLAEGYIAWKIAIYGYTVATESAAIQTIAMESSLLKLELTGRGVPATMASIAGGIGAVTVAAIGAASKIMLMVAALGVISRGVGMATDSTGQKIKDLQTDIANIDALTSDYNPLGNLKQAGSDIWSGHPGDATDQLGQAIWGWLPGGGSVKEKYTKQREALVKQLTEAQDQKKKETEDALKRDLDNLDAIMKKYEEEANAKTADLLKGLGGSGNTPPGGGSPGSGSSASYTEPFKEYVQEVERSLPQVNDVIDEHKRKLDEIGIQQNILKNKVSDNIPTLEQEATAYGQLDQQLKQHKEIQTDLHATADQYREAMDGIGAAIAAEDAKLAAGTISEKDHRQSVETLRDEYNKLNKSVEDMGKEWWQEEANISSLTTSVKSNAVTTREYRDNLIKGLKDEIDYLTRDGASQEELSRAYTEQGTYITLLMQKRADLDKQIAEGEAKISSLQKAQEALDTSTEQGALQYDFYGQAIAEASGKLADLKSKQIEANKAIAEGNDLIAKNRMSDLKEKYDAHMMTLEQYIAELEKLENQYKSTMSAEEQWQVDLAESNAYLSQWTDALETALDKGQKAFDEATAAIDEDIQSAQDSLDSFKDSVDDVFDSFDKATSGSKNFSNSILQGISQTLPDMMDLTTAAAQIGIKGFKETDYLDSVDTYLNSAKSAAELTSELTGVGSTMNSVLGGQWVATGNENKVTTTTTTLPTELPTDVSSFLEKIYGGQGGIYSLSDVKDVVYKYYSGQSLTSTESQLYNDVISGQRGNSNASALLNLKPWTATSTTTYDLTKEQFKTKMEDSIKGLALASNQIDTALSDVDAWRESEVDRIDTAIQKKQDDLKDDIEILDELFDDLDKKEAAYSRETALANYNRSFNAAKGIKATGANINVSQLETLAKGLPGQLDMTQLVDASKFTAEQFATAIQQGLTTLEDAKITAEGYIQDLADSTQVQIDAIDAQLKALDEEAKGNTREDALEAHNKKIKELNDKLAYEQVRTGQEHLNNIKDINQQIADENESWADTQRDWGIDDKRAGLEEQKTALQKNTDAMNQALSDFITYINSEIQARKDATTEYKDSLNDKVHTEVAALESEKSIVEQRAELLTTMLTAEKQYITDAVAKWKELADARVDITQAETDSIIANYNKQKEALSETWTANENGIRSMMQSGTLAQLAMQAALGKVDKNIVQSLVDSIADKGIRESLQPLITSLNNTASANTVYTPPSSGTTGGTGGSGTGSGTGTGTGGGTTTPTTPTRIPWKAHKDANGVYQDPATGKWMAASSLLPSDVFAKGKGSAFHYLGTDGIDYYSIGDVFRNSGLGYTVDPPGADGWINAYAKGTDYAKGGWSLVGEEGPELLNLSRGSQVMSNPDLMSLLQTPQPPIEAYIDTSGITAYLKNFGKVQVDLNAGISQATDRIVAAIEKRMGISIDKAVHIDTFVQEDNLDVEILGRDVSREIMRKVGQRR